jgi:ArsR family transcriptional regulator
MTCSPTSDAVAWSAKQAIATKLAALAHPARIDILQHLAGVDACCCKDVVQKFDLAQSTVSQHLKVLVDAGLVRVTPERQRSRYEADRVALAQLAATVSGLLSSCCAEYPALRD